MGQYYKTASGKTIVALNFDSFRSHGKLKGRKLLSQNQWENFAMLTQNMNNKTFVSTDTPLHIWKDFRRILFLNILLLFLFKSIYLILNLHLIKSCLISYHQMTKVFTRLQLKQILKQNLTNKILESKKSTPIQKRILPGIKILNIFYEKINWKLIFFLSTHRENLLKAPKKDTKTLLTFFLEAQTNFIKFMPKLWNSLETC